MPPRTMTFSTTSFGAGRMRPIPGAWQGRRGVTICRQFPRSMIGPSGCREPPRSSVFRRILFSTNASRRTGQLFTVYSRNVIGSSRHSKRIQKSLTFRCGGSSRCRTGIQRPLAGEHAYLLSYPSPLGGLQRDVRRLGHRPTPSRGAWLCGFRTRPARLPAVQRAWREDQSA